MTNPILRFIATVGSRLIALAAILLMLGGIIVAVVYARYYDNVLHPVSHNQMVWDMWVAGFLGFGGGALIAGIWLGPLAALYVILSYMRRLALNVPDPDAEREALIDRRFRANRIPPRVQMPSAA